MRVTLFCEGCKETRTSVYFMEQHQKRCAAYRIALQKRALQQELGNVKMERTRLLEHIATLEQRIRELENVHPQQPLFEPFSIHCPPDSSILSDLPDLFCPDFFK